MQRLDGLPLAIELAAAQVATLGVDDLIEQWLPVAGAVTVRKPVGQAAQHRVAVQQFLHGADAGVERVGGALVHHHDRRPEFGDPAQLGERRDRVGQIVDALEGEHGVVAAVPSAAVPASLNVTRSLTPWAAA